MKFDELQNKMKSKDEKIATLEKSISTVKERCTAKLLLVCSGHQWCTARICIGTFTFYYVC